MEIVIFIVVLLLLYGLVSMFFGVINAAKNVRRCGYCMKEVHTKAMICPHCQTTFKGQDKFF